MQVQVAVATNITVFPETMSQLAVSQTISTSINNNNNNNNNDKRNSLQNSVGHSHIRSNSNQLQVQNLGASTIMQLQIPKDKAGIRTSLSRTNAYDDEEDDEITIDASNGTNDGMPTNNNNIKGKKGDNGNNPAPIVTSIPLTQSRLSTLRCLYGSLQISHIDNNNCNLSNTGNAVVAKLTADDMPSPRKLLDGRVGYELTDRGILLCGNEYKRLSVAVTDFMSERISQTSSAYSSDAPLSPQLKSSSSTSSPGIGGTQSRPVFRSWDLYPFNEMTRKRMETLTPDQLLIKSFGKGAIGIFSADQRYYLCDESPSSSSPLVPDVKEITPLQNGKIGNALLNVYLDLDNSARNGRLILQKGMEIIITANDGSISRIYVNDISQGSAASSSSSSSASTSPRRMADEKDLLKKTIHNKLNSPNPSDASGYETGVSSPNSEPQSRGVGKSLSFTKAEDSLESVATTERKKQMLFEEGQTLKANKTSNLSVGFHQRSLSFDTQDSNEDSNSMADNVTEDTDTESLRNGKKKERRASPARSAMKKVGSNQQLKKKISWNSHSQDLVSGETLSQISDADDVEEDGGGVLEVSSDKSPVGVGKNERSSLIIIDGISVSAELDIDAGNLSKRVKIGGLLGHRADVASCATIGTTSDCIIQILGDKNIGVVAAITRVGHSFQLIYECSLAKPNVVNQLDSNKDAALKRKSSMYPRSTALKSPVVQDIKMCVRIPLRTRCFPVNHLDVFRIDVGQSPPSSIQFKVNISPPMLRKPKGGNPHQMLLSINVEVTSQVRPGRFNGGASHIRGDTEAFTIRPGNNVQIGKSSLCGISIRDSKMGREHATVFRRAISGKSAYFVESHDDKKPTYLLLGKGEVHYRPPLALSVDDVFKAGRSEFRCVYLRNSDEALVPLAKDKSRASMSKKNDSKSSDSMYESGTPKPYSDNVARMLRTRNRKEEILARTVQASSGGENFILERQDPAKLIISTTMASLPTSNEVSKPLDLKKAEEQAKPKLIPLDDDGLLDYFGLTNVSGPMLILLCVKGPFQRRFFLMHPSETIIGSSPDCNVSVRSDKALSAYHCRVYFDYSTREWKLEDTSSTNGTWYRLRAENSCLVSTGDVFQMGKTNIKFTGVVSKKSGSSCVIS